VDLPVELDVGNVRFRTRRIVHGVQRLSPEYEFAVLPSNAVVEPNFAVTNDEKTVISCSWNIPKAIISLLQVFFAASTLYRARGDQLNRYGLAAFSLTVLPYIVMSIVNLLGNLVTPDYPTLFLVRSPEMTEAEQSYDCLFDGIIGNIVEKPRNNTKDDKEPPFVAHTNKEGFTLTRVHAEGDTTLPDVGPEIKIDAPPPTSGTDISPEQDEIKTIVSQDPSLQNSTNKITAPSATDAMVSPEQEKPNPIVSQEPTGQEVAANIPPVPSVYLIKLKQGRLNFKQDRLNIPQFIFPACSSIRCQGPQLWSAKISMVWLLFTTVVLGSIIWGLIGYLTNFSIAQSSTAQRVWIMGWLVVGTLNGSSIRSTFITSLLAEISASRSLNVFMEWCVAFIFAPLAIGGMVTAGQMLQEYGSCNTLL
jgi:hypothetical protein